MLEVIFKQDLNKGEENSKQRKEVQRSYGRRSFAYLGHKKGASAAGVSAVNNQGGSDGGY